MSESADYSFPTPASLETPRVLTALIEAHRHLAKLKGMATMKYDSRKISDMVLAVLGVFEFENGRVWKRIDFGVMDELFEKGYLTGPKGRSQSVLFNR